jgi:hypothetical protein
MRNKFLPAVIALIAVFLAATPVVAQSKTQAPAVAQPETQTVPSTSNVLGIDQILAFFDESVTPSNPNQAPALQGATGSWPGVAGLRLQWMRSVLAAAQYCDQMDQTGLASILLFYAYLSCDNQPWPADLVEGEAAPQLAEMIGESLANYLNGLKPVQPL